MSVSRIIFIFKKKNAIKTIKLELFLQFTFTNEHIYFLFRLIAGKGATQTFLHPTRTKARSTFVPKSDPNLAWSKFAKTNKPNRRPSLERRLTMKSVLAAFHHIVGGILDLPQSSSFSHERSTASTTHLNNLTASTSTSTEEASPPRIRVTTDGDAIADVVKFRLAVEQQQWPLLPTMGVGGGGWGGLAFFLGSTHTSPRRSRNLQSLYNVL